MQPREIVKLALLKIAAACIFYHNHPLCFAQGVDVDAVSSLLAVVRRGPDDRRRAIMLHFLHVSERDTLERRLHILEYKLYVVPRRQLVGHLRFARVRRTRNR